MAKKRGLGKKGYDALLTADIEKEENIQELKEFAIIDINKIGPNDKQPRKVMKEENLQELAESIKQKGVIEPIIVVKTEGDFFEIVAGERRWRAAKLAGLKEVPIRIRDFTPQEVMEIALIENIQREDLNPVEEAEAYQSLIKEYNLTQDEVAEKVSKSRTSITNSLRLLKLDKRVRGMLSDEQLTTGHARALLGLKNKTEQYSVATKIVNKGLSVRETEKLVKNLTSPKKEKTNVEDKQDEVTKLIYKDYEEKLKQAVGTKVSIKNQQDGKGKIEIDYYSQDEFERIMEVILNK